MIQSTTPEIPGYEVVGILGLVRGNTVRSRNLFRDLLAVFKNWVGGEIDDYTKLLAEAREQALDRMLAEAAALDADAVINVRFATSEITSGAAEFLCYGTAVKLVQRDRPSA